MAFADFMKTEMVLKHRGVKDKFGYFSYTDENILGRLQKTTEWNVSPDMVQVVRRGKIYVLPEVDVKPGDKVEVDSEEFVVGDVSFIRDIAGVLHHKAVDI